MDRRYVPKSAFLRAVLSEAGPLSGSAEGAQNLKQLIRLTEDADVSNRDWAIFLLAQEEVDGEDVRAALFNATNDADNVVRAEALLGLAKRDRSLALPLVRKELAGEVACVPLFEAAALLADSSLVEDLRDFAAPSGNAYLDSEAAEALQACEGMAPRG